MASRLFAPAVRGAARAQPLALVPKRFNSSAVPTFKDPLLQQRAEAKAHAQHSTELWRKISYYVCLPGCFVLGVYIYQIETAHIQHRDHELAENGGELPEEDRPKYEYINIRKKPFPWGLQSLFYNPKAQYPAEL